MSSKKQLSKQPNSLIQNIRSRVLRSIRTHKNTKKLKAENFFVVFLRFIGRVIKQLKIFIFIFFLIILVLLIGVHIHQYNRFIPHDINNNQSDQDLTGTTSNILVMGFNKVSEYLYVEYLVLASVNSQSGILRTYSINPYYIVSTSDNRKYTLKSLWNNIQDENSKADIFMGEVSDLIGVPIDRYITFTNEDLLDVIENLDLRMNTIDKFNGLKKFYSQGDEIEGAELIDYLFGLSEISEGDTNTKRQLSFFNSIVQSNRNPVFYYKAFWTSESLYSAFQTNLTKTDLARFLNDLFNSVLPIRSGSLLSTEGEVGSTGSEDGIIPNYIEIDEEVIKVFRDIEVTREQVKIEVYNAGSEAGIASKFKRLLQNSGATVINSGNYSEQVEKTTLYIPDGSIEDFPYTVAYMKSLFQGELNISIGDYRYNYSGNLILVIGD
jgi:anionic cell wall polymer biosynthesis LytR-Cps2A-Psr (LCP) family protein